MNTLHFNPSELGLSVAVLWILLSFFSACLAICFNEMLKPGNLFNWYAKILLKACKKSRVMNFLSKPLGLCPFCNGTWIGIFVYFYFFGFNLPIFLFIGINYFFIQILFNVFNNK